MPTVTLTPSTYYLSSTSYLSVADASNMYANCDSTTYATVTNSRTSTTSYYLYVRGFDLSVVPSDAIVTSFSVRVKASHSGGYAQALYLYDGTSTSYGSSSTTLSTTATTHTINVTHDWADLVAAGSDLGIRINCRRASRNTTAYVYVYGAEIEVTYTLPVYHSITVTNPTSATVAVSDTSPLEGSDVTVVASTLSGITVTDNGTDVTSQFVQGGSDTVTSYPTAYEVSGSISGTHYQQCIGQGLDNSVSGNDYSSSSGTTAHIDYSFDLSDVPAGATIQSVSVQVKGHCESTSSSSEVATLQLYSGTTAKGSEAEFTSTSDQTITMTAGTWTAAELQDAILRFTIGYYGGAVSGAEWTVTYEVDGWVYVITNVVADHALVFSAGSSGPQLYFKDGSTWVQVTTAYRKVSGTWQQVALDQAFTSGTNYRRAT